MLFDHLPHLSTYKIFWKPECRPATNHIATTVADAKFNKNRMPIVGIAE